MGLGEAGLCLLEDIRTKSLKPYRYAEVKTLRSENEYLDEGMEGIRQEALNGLSEELSVRYVMLKHFKERNERILRNYSFHRSRVFLDAFFLKENISHLLSQEEEEYLEKHSKILAEYMEPFGVLDFSATKPPIEFFVQIVTLENCGVVMDEGDLVELKKDRIYFVRKATIIHLINSGLISIIR